MGESNDKKELQRLIAQIVQLLLKQDITKSYMRLFWIKQMVILGLAAIKLLFIGVIFFLVYSTISKHVSTALEVQAMRGGETQAFMVTPKGAKRGEYHAEHNRS